MGSSVAVVELLALSESATEFGEGVVACMQLSAELEAVRGSQVVEAEAEPVEFLLCNQAQQGSGLSVAGKLRCEGRADAQVADVLVRMELLLAAIGNTPLF